ncbi:MAG: serine hydrolase [Rhodobacterales bacterium]|nr:serine hydrolase [Rhodobacterales bacterium]
MAVFHQLCEGGLSDPPKPRRRYAGSTSRLKSTQSAPLQGSSSAKPWRARRVGPLRLRRPEVHESFLNFARTAPLSFTPGAGYKYSNVGHPLAALIVLQRDTGTFDEIAQRRLFQPLGPKHTGIKPARIDDFLQRAAPPSVSIRSSGLSSRPWNCSAPLVGSWQAGPLRAWCHCHHTRQSERWL